MPEALSRLFKLQTAIAAQHRMLGARSPRQSAPENTINVEALQTAGRRGLDDTAETALKAVLTRDEPGGPDSELIRRVERSQDTCRNHRRGGFAKGITKESRLVDCALSLDLAPALHERLQCLNQLPLQHSEIHEARVALGVEEGRGNCSTQTRRKLRATPASLVAS